MYRENVERARAMEQVQTLPSDDPLEMGVADSFSMAAQQFMAENLTTSNDKAVQRFFGERDTELTRMMNTGEIPPDVVNLYRKVVGYSESDSAPRYKSDYHGLAQWSNDNLATSFDTDDTEMRQVMAGERRERQRRLANGSAAGEFAGNMWAAMHDPVVLGATVATFPISYGAGGSVTSLILRTAITEGAIGMATEVPIQLDVMDFKERIDSPYTVDDAIANVLAAGAGAAVLSGVGAGIGRLVDIRFRSAPEDVDPSEAFETVIREELSTNRPDVPRFQAPEIHAADADEFAPYRDIDVDGRPLGEHLDEVDVLEDQFDERLQAFVACMES